MKFKVNDACIETDKLTVLAGTCHIIPRPTVPFEDRICQFLEDLSVHLMKYKNDPDIISLAFWCRKHHILQLKNRYEQGMHRMGRGIAFHIAPSNIPVNFAFSYVFGLLAGNVNIVRVPSHHTSQVKIICEVIERLFREEKYNRIQEMTALVRYDHDDEINQFFMLQCQISIVWGGDRTIEKMQGYRHRPRCHQIVFADRYSVAVCQSEAILTLSESELVRLAGRFYNDTYLMDQNGCSSPRLVIWLGQNKEAGKKRFWQAVYEKVKAAYSIAPVVVMDKYTKLCSDIMLLEGVKHCTAYDNYLYRIQMEDSKEISSALRGYAGYFYEYNADDLKVLADIVDEKFQTITYFGMSKEQLIECITEAHLLGVDRIVPMGKAMDMDIIWDGYDLIDELTRVIRVE